MQHNPNILQDQFFQNYYLQKVLELLLRHQRLIFHEVKILSKYGYVVQKWVETPLFAGQLPTLGLWMVGHQCAGMSIREDCYDIIGNDAHFAAHYFVE